VAPRAFQRPQGFSPGTGAPSARLRLHRRPRCTPHASLFSIFFMSDTALRYVQECEDTLSIASTHVEDDGPHLHAPAGRSPSHCGWRSRGEFDCVMSPTLAHMDSKRPCWAPARTRGSNYVSLNGLGIKPKSPSASAQPSSSISIMSMSLGTWA